MGIGNNLCCCEYVDVNEQRNHILACCCNCEHLDRSVDKLLMGQKVSTSLLENLSLTLEDRLRIPWYGGARKVRLELLLALAIIPGSLLIATMSIYWTCISLTFVFTTLFYLLYFCKPSIRSNFFVDCVVVTNVTIVFIFELYTVPFLEILIHENVIFFTLFVFHCAFIVIAAKRTVHQKVGLDANDDKRYCMECEVTVPSEYHHSIWMATCIGEHNRRYYYLSILFAVLSLAYGANLTLTTVCHPFRVYKVLLLPYDCSEVYTHFEYALSFVNAVFSLTIVSLLLCNLLLYSLGGLISRRKRRYTIVGVA